MPLHLSWTEIALRLLLTVIAGGVIGANRGERGRPAGLRTTILVCLAASVSMIEANLLLGTAGKPASSFVTLDLMRLPLGILSGMGFIGAGAIVRRGDLVHGITTAATLWFVTVVGICLGGGQLALGSATLVIGFLVLWGLKWIEQKTLEKRTGTLTLIAKGEREEEVLAGLTASGYNVQTVTATFVNRTQRRKLTYRIRWRGGTPVDETPDFVRQLAERPGIERVSWTPQIS